MGGLFLDYDFKATVAGNVQENRRWFSPLHAESAAASRRWRRRGARSAIRAVLLELVIHAFQDGGRLAAC